MMFLQAVGEPAERWRQPDSEHCNRLARKKQKRHYGLRSFIRAENRSAVDVGHLRQDTRPLHVQEPNFSEAYPEAAIKEGADELTLRADEVVTLRAFIHTDHIKFERWGPPLVDVDWHELKGKNGKSCTATTER